ncbi:tRNA (5-methylaminomethyl-2-thiouridine)(34)-methyltransferase MnmD [Autumnicola musiva]|uniref:tRNA (5-methylaminomethyl-2-thiouridine)(34)-methyltransferase MnmD n=1 Tax=Autumnicola musiva TaxID=3075589 RepID=A0ABU3D9E6_9FLAO|nr:tRNA (5-methylaminomethyl-2-thiouridine)(34)-methyltransferase MnmD [Zunongwangia sp. F117]MDT0678158.1 tRNA (5-methylaminomethyl-2-thiouridine)(34)-methyltransferase MnmD [Zunongwangia sp. F117]
MERKIITTADGSVTIHLPAWDEQYHSRHGAVQEAQHVFIKTGLHYFLKKYEAVEVKILEIGFGTGLNAFITFLEMQKLQKKIYYTGVEAYPVNPEEIEKLNYPDILSAEKYKDVFAEMHLIPWNREVEISKDFYLHKQKKKIEEISNVLKFNLIYFDAFGARVQPELWTEEIFERMFNSLTPGGVLVTYAAKGSVRRAMLKVGFKVEKLPGPPGKREMLRALKD